MKSKNYGNCIIATHASDINGPPDDLERFLLQKSDYLIRLSFPLTADDTVKPHYIIYKDGEEIERKENKVLFKRFFLLNYILDFFYTVVWSLKLKRKYELGKVDLFFGCNNILTIGGLIVRLLIRIEKVIFYAIDYSQDRFGNTLLNNIYQHVDRYAAKKADFVWSNTNRTRKVREKQGVKKASNILVRNGTYISDSKAEKEKDGKVRIEYHGYLSKGKGVQYVIKALSAIKNKNFTFDITGYGPFEKELKRLVDKSPHKSRIQFLGKKTLSEIIAKLPNYDLCVALINSKEDYLRYCDPMKIREALGSCVPVLTSKVPEVAKTISEKKLGIVVEDSENTKSIAKSLNSIFENPEELVKYRKNIEKIRTNFTWENIFVESLENI